MCTYSATRYIFQFLKEENFSLLAKKSVCCDSLFFEELKYVPFIRTLTGIFNMKITQQLFYGLTTTIINVKTLTEV
jgi:hypothetical protein